MSVRIAGVLQSRPDDVIRYIVMEKKGNKIKVKNYKTAEYADFWNPGADIYQVKIPA
ncbi:MAG: hypothetical protein IM557_08175 [Chitinophagaceae bacterium]|jgi:hypothetical protein|nr:hypothetical protein [Chitinophagaceae bacterium]